MPYDNYRFSLAKHRSSLKSSKFEGDRTSVLYEGLNNGSKETFKKMTTGKTMDSSQEKIINFFFDLKDHQKSSPQKQSTDSFVSDEGSLFNIDDEEGTLPGMIDPSKPKSMVKSDVKVA